jgi:hypothetical protein
VEKTVENEFVLEVVNHDDGRVTGTECGTAFHLSQFLQEILESLPENHGVVINKN